MVLCEPARRRCRPSSARHSPVHFPLDAPRCWRPWIWRCRPSVPAAACCPVCCAGPAWQLLPGRRDQRGRGHHRRGCRLPGRSRATTERFVQRCWPTRNRAVRRSPGRWAEHLPDRYGPRSLPPRLRAPRAISYLRAALPVWCSCPCRRAAARSESGAVTRRLPSPDRPHSCCAVRASMFRCVPSSGWPARCRTRRGWMRKPGRRTCAVPFCCPTAGLPGCPTTERGWSSSTTSSPRARRWRPLRSRCAGVESRSSAPRSLRRRVAVRLSGLLWVQSHQRLSTRHKTARFVAYQRIGLAFRHGTRPGPWLRRIVPSAGRSEPVSRCQPQAKRST
jgi:hypothetical protein